MIGFSGEGRSPDPRLELPTLKNRGFKSLGNALKSATSMITPGRVRRLDKVAELQPGEIHPLITRERSSGVGHYILMRQYAANDMEIVGMTLGADDSLKRGGGAKRKAADKDSMDEATLAKSRQRSRRVVKIKCRSGQVDRLLTLTYRENERDYDKCLADFKRFVRLMRKRFGEGFYYVAVPEEQKRGAIHFHLAIKGFYPINTVRRVWRKAVGDEFATGSDSVGNVDITNPRKHGKASWNPTRIAQYISKYVTKNETVGFNRKRYFSGGDIPQPVKMTGWTPIMVGRTDLDVLLDEVFRIHSRRRPDVSVQLEGYYNVVYKST